MASLLTNADPSQPGLIGLEPDRIITYGALIDNVESLTHRLAASDLKPGSRVAIVLPNGPEFIVAFLAITLACLTAAPFNPAQAAELEILWRDGEIRAVIALPDDATSARHAANLGIPRWTLTTNSTGHVELDIPSTGHAFTPSPDPDDIALFLYTSGTTSTPKGVPLTHRNLMASIGNIAECYRLKPDDRTLLVMPLFHVHGLIGATLSTLYSGGAVIAPSRFSAGSFWPTAKTHRATWYSAVPTIHRTLLLRAEADAPAQSRFRFIRSCSSALASAMLTQMENRFQAPVLEAYGMTEASHQIATNPIPPASHKAGSVGVGGRVEVAVVDDAGSILAANTPGEVAIKGPNVMGGYDRNPDANATAFVNGYLRTGDRGVIDADGYISLIGRIKELINRAGEKISPPEIDAVLLSHPAIAEAAAFGIPDVKYGEEVCAAVILKSPASEQELQTYCRDRLADFKVPKRLHLVTELPKTATGKVQRGVLAESLLHDPKK